jgi:predicted Zn-ribbon and HTH transcriptional regulator
MKYKETLKWFCVDCGVVFESTDEHHNLDYCPKCKINGVDHESYCIRILGRVIQVEE